MRKLFIWSLVILAACFIGWMHMLLQPQPFAKQAELDEQIARLRSGPDCFEAIAIWGEPDCIER
jgi:hypothetical protein